MLQPMPATKPRFTRSSTGSSIFLANWTHFILPYPPQDHTRTIALASVRSGLWETPLLLAPRNTLQALRPTVCRRRTRILLLGNFSGPSQAIPPPTTDRTTHTYSQLTCTTRLTSLRWPRRLDT